MTEGFTMKKLLLLAVTAMAFSSFAHAALYVVTCGNADVNDGNGTSPNITCPSFNNLLTPGGTGVYTNTSLRTLSSVTQIFDNQGNPIAGSAVMTYSSGAFTFTPVTSNPTTSANNVNGTSNTLIGPGNGSTFLVNFASTAATGTIGQATGSVAVVYNYSVPTSGVPEPSTLSLLGGSLLGLGFIARRRK
jgi:hypothetical protein